MKINSLRKWNKVRKRHILARDNNGKKLYWGDTVTLQIPHETNTTHTSVIYWTPLHGAIVDAHPAHVAMKLATVRNLSDYLEHVCVKTNNV